MTVDELRRRIELDPNFVNVKRFDYSLNKVLDRYPDGVPNKVIAQALMMQEEEIEEIYQRIVLKLRSALKVEVDE